MEPEPLVRVATDEGRELVGRLSRGMTDPLGPPAPWGVTHREDVEPVTPLLVPSGGGHHKWAADAGRKGGGRAIGERVFAKERDDLGVLGPSRDLVDEHGHGSSRLEERPGFGEGPLPCQTPDGVALPHPLHEVFEGPHRDRLHEDRQLASLGEGARCELPVAGVGGREDCPSTSEDAGKKRRRGWVDPCELRDATTTACEPQKLDHAGSERGVHAVRLGGGEPGSRERKLYVTASDSKERSRQPGDGPAQRSEVREGNCGDQGCEEAQHGGPL